MDHELTTALAEAEQALKEAETLLAWRELEISERRSGCDFWLAADSSCGRDLKVQLGRFISIFFFIHECTETRPSAARMKSMQPLQRLWEWFRALERRVVNPGVIPSGA